MKQKFPLFLVLAFLAVSVPAQASMHGAAEAAGISHFAFHAQMTWQAAMTGNWSAFWQLFTEQSICANTWATFIFTPAGFMLAAAMMIAAMVMLIGRLVQKTSQQGWWNRFRQPTNCRFA